MARTREKGTRAPNGASSIYLGSDGYWHGRVTVGVRDDGTPDRRHVKRKKEADVIRAVRELEKLRDRGQVRKPGQPWTVAQWLNHWLDTIAGPSVRYKTLTYYRTAIVKYLTPGIGAHKITRLEPEHIENLYARLRKEGTQPATLQQIHRTLRAALNEATRRQRLERNPITVVKSPPMVEAEIDPLSALDAQAILAAAADHRNCARWAVALSLGLRQGEALGLQWPDIDITWCHGCDPTTPCGTHTPADCPAKQPTGTLTVRRAIQRHSWQHGCDPTKPCGHKRGAECPARHSGGLVIVEPKSRAGRRLISLPPPLVWALLAHRRTQDAERALAAELWHDDGWVFAQPNGRPIDPRADYNEWKTLLRAAGVREARLHDARHTAATMLLVLNVPSRMVMDLMGWSQLSMTQRYQHVPDQLRRDVAEKLGQLLWSTDHGDHAGDHPGAPQR
jgi:integrase